MPPRASQTVASCHVVTAVRTAKAAYITFHAVNVVICYGGRRLWGLLVVAAIVIMSTI